MKSEVYVLGFLFNRSGDMVALIEKKRPEWQAGKWNGIGGSVESGETLEKAMKREFKEESGVNVETWENYCVLHNEDCYIYIFRAFSFDIVTCKTMTDESVKVFDVNRLPDNSIPNLYWLIPMALSMDADRCSKFSVREIQ